MKVQTLARYSLYFMMFLVTISSALADDIWSETFEDNDCTDWTGCSIESTTVYNGTYSGKKSAVEQAISPSWSSMTENFNVSFAYNPTDSGGTATYLGVGTGLSYRGISMLHSNYCTGENFCIDVNTHPTYLDTGVVATYGTWMLITIEFNNTEGVDYGNVYFNGTMTNANVPFNPAYPIDKSDIVALTYQINSYTPIIDDILVYNFTYSPFPIPSINQSTYNVTSAIFQGENRVAWRNDNDTYVNSTDSTPTVTFSLDFAGNCSIGLNDWNYTTMVANDSDTKCSTTEAINMTCTIPTSQVASANNNTYYIACITLTGLENVTSTSSGLNLYYNSPPSVPNLTAPNNNSIQEVLNISFEYFSTDLNNDNITYFLYAGYNSTNLSLRYSGEKNFSLIVEDGDTWLWRVSAYDGVTNSANSSDFNFTVDIPSSSSGGSDGGGGGVAEVLEAVESPSCENVGFRLKGLVPIFLNEATIERFVDLVQAFFDWIICKTQVSIIDVDLTPIP